MTELSWRPPTRADDAAWADLLAAVEAVDQRGETYGPDDLADEWASVWAHPAGDAAFVWDGAELVAFAWLKAIPGERASHRVACWGAVRPSHRGRGLGTQVLGWSVRRGSAVAAGFDPSLPTLLEVDASDRQLDVLALAAGAGFEPVRRFLEIARPTALSVPVVPAPAGLELVPWSPALDAEAHRAHTEAFADHWGSEPRSGAAWAQWYTGHRHFRPDLSVLAVDPVGGTVAGLVLTAAYPQDWATLPVEAWINTVGTRRAWRGRGVARWALSEVLRRVAAADTGFERSILGVDAENPTGALGLYRSLGYEDVRTVTTLTRPPLPRRPLTVSR